MTMAHTLEGRLEEVFIIDQVRNRFGKPSEKCAVGLLGREREKVFVSDGVNHINRNCLVRFDCKLGTEHDLRYHTPISSFISTKIPANFSGLAPQDFILYGIWEQWMIKKEDRPYLSEICNYFSPGEVGWAIYCQNGSQRNHGRYACYFESFRGRRLIESSKMSISRIIRHSLPDPFMSARMMISEGREEAVKVIAAIKENGLVPIEIENLGR
jgi:hypothetical protein